MKKRSKEHESTKRICFLTDVFMMGGVESVILESLKYLAEYEICIMSLYYRPDEELLKELPNNVRFIERKMSLKRLSRVLAIIPYLSKFYFKRVLGKEKFDYLIAVKPDTMNVCFSRNGAQSIYWCHNDYHVRYANMESMSYKARIKGLLLKTMYKKHNMVWAVSDEIAQGLRKAFKINNVFSLANPLDCKGIVEKAKMNCDVKFNSNEINLVLLGRLSKEKGFDRVIKILAKLKNTSNFHLYIIGDGGERHSLETMVADFNLNNEVTFLGKKTNPYPYLKQASLFICPSLTESFGLSIMEAMLLEVPVITTNTSGGEYVTQRGLYACCVENSDVALEKIIEYYLKDLNRYDYSLERAKNWAQKHDTEVFGKKLRTLLE